MHYITFVLLFLTWDALACLFCNNKKSIFGKCKGPFESKVKWISLRLKKRHVCTVEELSAVLPFWIADE